jgi:hypothetical protein
MNYELVKPLRGRMNALRAVKRVKSFLTPEGLAIISMGCSPMIICMKYYIWSMRQELNSPPLKGNLTLTSYILLKRKKL